MIASPHETTLFRFICWLSDSECKIFNDDCFFKFWGCEENEFNSKGFDLCVSSFYSEYPTCEAQAIGILRNSSYSPNPFVIPAININIHAITFLTVIPDWMHNSSLKSCSVKEPKQLPSIDSYPTNYLNCTKFIIESRKTYKLQPNLNIIDCPFDWLLG